MDIKLEILLENLTITCKYFEDNPEYNCESCSYTRNGRECNCGGDIQNCDLKAEDLR